MLPKGVPGGTPIGGRVAVKPFLPTKVNAWIPPRVPPARTGRSDARGDGPDLTKPLRLAVSRPTPDALGAALNARWSSR